MNSLVFQPLPFELKLDYLRLSRTEHVGSIGFFYLLKRFGSPKEALKKLPAVITRKDTRIPSVEEISREILLHEKKGFQLISYFQPEYPSALRELRDPPPFLSTYGDLNLLQEKGVGMVGSRSASQASEVFVHKLVLGLKAEGYPIISGLARGIDTWVHQACLENDVPTIAVVAGGLGNVYPLENKQLHETIGQKGLVLSEDPLGSMPQASLFPKRNRIISGLSWAVAVIEAGAKSGALLTAKYGADQGRTVFAAPGHPLDLRCKGSNQLLKEGALFLESAQDIIQERFQQRPAPNTLFSAHEDGDEYEIDEPFSDLCPQADLFQQIQQALNFIPTPIPEIALHLKASEVQVRNALVEMELNGQVLRYPGDCVMAPAQEFI